MGRSTRRGPWLPEEDNTLLHLVQMQGPNNWVRISQHMQHRSPKQCRERYHQNLKPSLNHEPISNDEGEMIEELVQEMGKRWAEIARRLGNRSDNAVKNWWNGSMNRRKRNTTSASRRAVGPRQLPVPATASSRADKAYNTTFISESRPSPPAGYFDPSSYRDNASKADQAYAPFAPHYSRDGNERQLSPEQIHVPYPNLLTTDFSCPPGFPHSYSAPGSLPATPSAHRSQQLQPPPPPRGLRPPPLDRHPLLDWPLPRLEAPAISPAATSPAATEFSTTPSFPQPPSLISDNQSHYSISPKTISSPRPGMPAPIDTSNGAWNAEPRRNSYGAYLQPNKSYVDEGYVSARPPSALIESSTDHFPLDPSLRRTVSHPRVNPKVNTKAQLLSSPTERDARMNVSRLLD